MLPSDADGTIERMFAPARSPAADVSTIMHARVSTRQPQRKVDPDQFTRRHNDVTLLRVVLEVSRAAAPDAPTRCRQDDFDGHRSAAGWPKAPRGKNIAAQLGMAWPKLLAVAHGPETQWTRELGLARSDRGRKGISLDQVLIALRQVALHLEVTELSRDDYKEAREEIVAASRRAYKHGGGAAATLPGLHQIDEVLEQNELTWQQGLERAGLASPPAGSKAGPSNSQLIATFAEATGFAPRNVTQLLTWARNAEAPSRVMNVAEFAVALAEFEAERSERGEGPLPVAPRKIDQTAGPVQGQPRRRKRSWNPASIIVGMADAVPDLRPGERLDQRSLKRIAKINPKVPSWSTVDRHRRKAGADFEDWRRQALELAAKRPLADLTGPPPASAAGGDQDAAAK